MQPSKNPQWQEAAKKLIEMEELRNCTFKPKIRNYVHKSPSSNMSKLLNQSHLKSPSIS
jgi:hypothetical protein